MASGCRDCPECRSDLQLDAKIVALTEADPNGDAGVVVNVALTDGDTGKGVGSFKAEGKSSSRTEPANKTSEAVEHAAEKIVKFVAKSM